MLAERDGARAADRHRLLAGGWLGLVGGVGYFVVLLIHGDLPDQSTAAAFEHVAGRPEWGLLKWLLIAFVFCWVGAFSMLADSLRGGMSSVLARWSSVSVLVGATLVLIEYSILGYGFRNAADAWAAAPASERDALLAVGDALLAMTGGLFLNFITWLLGLPFLLMGLAVALDSGFPRWLGWVAVLGGAGAFVSGAARFLELFFVPFPLLYGGFVIPLVLWLAVVGVLMIRRAASDRRIPS